MTTANTSDIAQTLAAVATVLSLLFVGVQIRQNTRATRAASHNNVSNSLNEINRMQNRKKLSAEERWRFDATARAYLHVCETMFVQAELGSGHEGVHLAEEMGMAAIMASPGVAEWWAENPFGFCAEFRDYVAKVVATEGSEG